MDAKIAFFNDCCFNSRPYLKCIANATQRIGLFENLKNEIFLEH